MTVDNRRARVELLLTTGWCPFASRVLDEVRERVEQLPGIDVADVEVIWTQPWTTERLSPSARAKNAFGRPGEMFSNHLYAFHNALTPDDQPKLPPEEFLRQWTPTDIRHMVYDQSDTDMLVAMPLPLTDLFKDGLSPWEECAHLATLDPDRTVFWGSVNPLEGRKALDLMERQVGEFGAKVLQVLQRSL